MHNPPYHVLFLCSENACRSIMAEAILNHWGEGRFIAHSAGAEPKGDVNPMALETLTELGVSTEGLASKHWSSFHREDSPTFDFVFTVCDAVHNESCPTVLGQPVRAHWGMEDPSKFAGPEDIKRLKFKETAIILESCARMLTQIPMEGLDKVALKDALHGIESIIEDARKTPETVV